jgi:hypothetical protein
MESAVRVGRPGCSGFFFALVNAASASPDLLRERQGPGNQDRLTQGLTFVLMTAHWILAGLDVGRFHWSPVADTTIGL